MHKGGQFDPYLFPIDLAQYFWMQFLPVIIFTFFNFMDYLKKTWFILFAFIFQNLAVSFGNYFFVCEFQGRRLKVGD